MKRYTKELPETEVDEFFKLFGDRKNKFRFSLSHKNGRIVSCETDDIKIMKFLK